MWKIALVGVATALKRNLTKTGRDLALTLYEDLDFHAMSLPRVFAAIFSLAVITSWIAEQFFGLPFSHFDSLAVLCGGIWSAYALNKWKGYGRNDEDHND